MHVLHVRPAEYQLIESALYERFDDVTRCSYDDLQKHLRPNASYLFWAYDRNPAHFLVDENIPSQTMRRIIGDVLGLEDVDWRVARNWRALRHTTETLARTV